jgi:hypothetical protein
LAKQKFTADQEEALKNISKRVEDKVEQYYRTWAKPIKTRNVITTQSTSLAKYGLNLKDFEQYLIQNNILEIAHVERTGAAVAFPKRALSKPLDHDQIMEALEDYAVEEVRSRTKLNDIRRRIKAGEIL